MSVCTFIAADYELEEHFPSQEYPVSINIDKGIIDDGNADDNYYLNYFRDVDLYTDKKYGVYLEWNYTENRAKNIIEYIKDALENTDIVELWHVWLMDVFEYENRPIIHKYEISINDLKPEDILKLENSKIWNDINRPTYYCLIIKK